MITHKKINQTLNWIITVGLPLSSLFRRFIRQRAIILILKLYMTLKNNQWIIKHDENSINRAMYKWLNKYNNYINIYRPTYIMVSLD